MTNNNEKNLALPLPPTELLSPAPMSLATTNLPVAPPRAKTVTENLIGSFPSESHDQTGNCELDAESSKRDDDDIIKVNEGDFVSLHKQALQVNNILDLKDMKDPTAAERLFQRFETMENQIRILNEENAKLKSEQGKYYHTIILMKNIISCDSARFRAWPKYFSSTKKIVHDYFRDFKPLHEPN